MKRFAFSLFAALLVTVAIPVFMSADEEEKPAEVKDEPGSLKDCARAVGGVWIAEEGIENPDAPHGRFVAEWGVNEKVCRSRTYWLQNGKETQIYEGAQYWHPKRKELVFYEVSFQGELYEGTIVKRDGRNVTKWTSFSDKGEVEYEQHGEYLNDDTMSSELYYKKDGRWVLLRKYKLHRKPLDWKPEKKKQEDEK